MKKLLLIAFLFASLTVKAQYTITGMDITNVLHRTNLTAINATGTITAAQLSSGTITCNSAVAVSLTLPTATLLATHFSASQGYYLDFMIDNTASTSLGVVTLVLGSGFTTLAVITGSNTMTTAIGKVGVFRIYFSSATAAFLVRLG